MLKVYTKADCSKCLFTEKWLEAHKVPYEEEFIDVETEISKVDFLRNKGMISFPVVVPDDDWSRAWGDVRMDKLEQYAQSLED